MFVRNIDYSGDAKIQYFMQDMNPPPFVELYVIDFNTALGYTGNSRPVLYLTSDRQPFQYENTVYQPRPVQFDSEAIEINKPVLKPKLKLSSLDSSVITAIKSYPILTGSIVLRFLTLSIFEDSRRSAYLSNPGTYNLENEAFQESWFVENVIGRDFTEVIFQLTGTLGLDSKPAFRSITGVELIGNC